MGNACGGSFPNTCMECTEEGCSDPAEVRVYVPWADDRNVCAAHARALVQKEGVVARPLD